MQAGDKPDITYRRQKYRRQEPEREEEEVEELDPGQDTMGDQDNPEYNSVVNILKIWPRVRRWCWISWGS